MTHFGAHALAAQGRFAEAAAVLTHELAMRHSAHHPYREVTPVDDPDAAPLLEQLATYLWHLARYPAAASALTRARALREASGQGSIGQLLGLEAALADRLGDPAAARLFGQAHAAMVDAHGEGSVEAAVARRNLGACLRDRGELVDAYRELTRALELLTRRLGRSHPETCAAHKALARYRLLAGQPRHALAIAEFALDSSLVAHRSDHPFVGGALLVAGTAHGALLAPRRALEHLQRAESIFAAAYGREHPLVAATLAELGDTAGAMGDPDAAAELHADAVRILAPIYPDHPLFARHLRRLAGALLRVGRGDEAGAPLRDAARILEGRTDPASTWLRREIDEESAKLG